MISGDIWTWTAICADTKLVPSWLVGDRDADAAQMLMQDLANRMWGRIQLTSDGHRPYLEAVEGAFGADIDYAMLLKLTAILATMRPAIARLSALAPKRIRSRVPLILPLSLPATSNGKTSPCA